MNDNEATLPVLKWLAGTTSVIVASAVVWGTSLMVGDLRSFGVSLARIEQQIVYLKETSDRLDTRVVSIERSLRGGK